MNTPKCRYVVRPKRAMLTSEEGYWIGDIQCRVPGELCLPIGWSSPIEKALFVGPFYTGRKNTNIATQSIYLYNSVCVCMFRHNYLSVNGILSFPSFTWLYKCKEEYKQGEMWHSAQRAEISEEICMFQPGHCQATGPWPISVESNNEELLIAMQRFRKHRYINGVGYKRKATDNFAAEGRKQDNELGLGVQKNTRGQPVKN
jgi:hypothetical protein